MCLAYLALVADENFLARQTLVGSSSEASTLRRAEFRSPTIECAEMIPLPNRPSSIHLVQPCERADFEQISSEQISTADHIQLYTSVINLTVHRLPSCTSSILYGRLQL